MTIIERTKHLQNSCGANSLTWWIGISTFHDRRKGIECRPQARFRRSPRESSIAHRVTDVPRINLIAPPNTSMNSNLRSLLRTVAALLAIAGLSSICWALTADEHAEGFLARALAAEGRGDIEVAVICYELANRAVPGITADDGASDAVKRRVAATMKVDAEKLAGEGKNLDAWKRYQTALGLAPDDEAIRAGAERLEAKLPFHGKSVLDTTVIPAVSFENARLGEAIEFLRVKIGEIARGTGGVTIVNAVTQDGGQAGTEIRNSVTLRLNHVPAREALKYVCDLTGTEFRIEAPRGDRFPVVTIVPKGAEALAQPDEARPSEMAQDHEKGSGRLTEWTDRVGRTIEAEFLRLEGRSVVVLKDGKEYTIAFTKLVRESVAQARQLGGAQGEAASE